VAWVGVNTRKFRHEDTKGMKKKEAGKAGDTYFLVPLVLGG
jgi:hypothetical protein